MKHFLLSVYAAGLIAACCSADDAVKVATFNVDATPPLGTPLAYKPAEKLADPLSARGVVLLAGDQKPIVLCAVDWIGIGNGGQDVWRNRLAEAAGTTPHRVAVHVLHQHDAPRCDFATAKLLESVGLGGRYFSEPFVRHLLSELQSAIKAAIEDAKTVTHVGVGKAKVEKVASNRRLLGADGKVKIMRWSKSTIPEAIAAPEGVIDPYVKIVSLWNNDTPLVVLSYYATHPQSYYGFGEISADFVGLARSLREGELPQALHVHFNGASGNVAAGKYNDGSKGMRPVLARRLATGMRKAWEATAKKPLAAADVSWKVVPVALPPGGHLKVDELETLVEDEDANTQQRITAARHLVWARRCKAGDKIDLSCLSLGNVRVLHMPGELFIEYQLAAQNMRPDLTVCTAAYGDSGPGYIGTEIAYAQGGYETSPRASRVAPEVEHVLMPAVKELLSQTP